MALFRIVLTQRPDSIIRIDVGHQGRRRVVELGNRAVTLKCHQEKTYVTSTHILFAKLCLVATNKFKVQRNIILPFAWN